MGSIGAMHQSISPLDPMPLNVRFSFQSPIISAPPTRAQMTNPPLTSHGPFQIGAALRLHWHVLYYSSVQRIHLPANDHQAAA